MKLQVTELDSITRDSKHIRGFRGEGAAVTRNPRSSPTLLLSLPFSLPLHSPSLPSPWQRGEGRGRGLDITSPHLALHSPSPSSPTPPQRGEGQGTTSSSPPLSLFPFPFSSSPRQRGEGKGTTSPPPLYRPSFLDRPLSLPRATRLMVNQTLQFR